MESSNIPAKFPIPWAYSAGGAYIRAIPTASQIGIQSGAASLTDGFPPVNSLPVQSGGTPPFMQDHNGILKAITLWNQWQQAGGPIFYDSAFSSAIGGYPSGTLLLSAAGGALYWYNNVENNTTDPDTGGAGWTVFPPLPKSAVLNPIGGRYNADGTIENWYFLDFGADEPEALYGPYNWAIPFPTAVLNIQVSTLTSNNTGNAAASDNMMQISRFHEPTTTQFWLWNNLIAGTNAARGFYVRAVGY